MKRIHDTRSRVNSINTRLNRKKMSIVVGALVVALIYTLLTVYYSETLNAWHWETRLPLSDLPDRFNAETKKILFWNTMFGNKNFYFGNGDLFLECPANANNCWAIHDRSKNPQDFDALLFHGSELDVNDIPKYRKKEQSYVFVNLESPENRPISDPLFDNNFFNFTMTYRLDSDITWTYGYVQSIINDEIVAPKVDVDWNLKITEMKNLKTRKSTWDEAEKALMRRQKRKTAIWFVSNCHSRSGREKYVKELAKHVDVDIHGSCGNSAGCPVQRDCFREVVEPHYYFYLSFENSMCQDYVTEKLYNALRHNVVPIVYGGANYTRFAPPGSFINALDFDSPKELANHLMRLIAQPMEYDKYFEWKKFFKIIDSTHLAACQLCQFLHEKYITKSYPSLKSWYARDKCPLQEKLKNSMYLVRSAHQ